MLKLLICQTCTLLLNRQIENESKRANKMRTWYTYTNTHNLTSHSFRKCMCWFGFGFCVCRKRWAQGNYVPFDIFECCEYNEALSTSSFFPLLLSVFRFLFLFVSRAVCSVCAPHPRRSIHRPINLLLFNPSLILYSTRKHIRQHSTIDNSNLLIQIWKRKEKRFFLYYLTNDNVAIGESLYVLIVGWLLCFFFSFVFHLF